MGLLVGALIGLSTMPVVGGAITALTALIGAFLGLSAPTIKWLPFALQSWRIIGFGVICVAAIIGGIYVRTHDLLRPPINEQVQILETAGFDPVVVRELVAYRNFGIVPDGKTAQMNEVSRGGVGGLFSTESIVCKQLVRTRGKKVTERLAVLKGAGNEYVVVAERIERNNPSNQVQLLNSAQVILCGI